MISTHCGKRLERLTSDRTNLPYHRWVCTVCRMKFNQRRRRPVGKKLSTFTNRNE